MEHDDPGLRRPVCARKGGPAHTHGAEQRQRGRATVQREGAPRRARVYTATVVFPEEGTYTYTVVEHVTGRTYEYDPVVIEAPVPAPTAGGSAGPQPVAAATSDDGFPLWPVLGGSFGLALVAAGLTVFLRRHRPPAAQAR